MVEERVKELKEVGIKEEEIRKFTPRQAAQILIEKKALTEVKEKEIRDTKRVKGVLLRRAGGFTEEGIISEEIKNEKIIKKI